MSSEWEIEQDVIATKESYILDCGYKIGEIRAPLLGWYALPPGQTHLIDPRTTSNGTQNYLGFFSTRQQLIVDVYEAIFPSMPLHDAARDLMLNDFLRSLAEEGASDLQKLLCSRGYEGDTLLHSACRGGNIEVAEALIEMGAPLQVQNYWGQTPMEVDGAQPVREWLASKQVGEQILDAMDCLGGDAPAPSARPRGLSL